MLPARHTQYQLVVAVPDILAVSLDLVYGQYRAY